MKVFETAKNSMSPAKSKNERRPTIIDVAKEARVGIMTVSRVINEYPTVRPSTRKKVLAAIAKIGYKPNQAARILKGMPSRTIGLVVPDMSDFFAACFHAVQNVAMSHNYQTIVVVTGRDASVEEQQLESIHQYRLAGLLIVSSGASGRSLEALQAGGVPVVALDRPIPGSGTDAVIVENREGGESGTRHLVEHGHKRIAGLAFEASAYTVKERMEGYRQAMRDARLEPIVHEDINSLAAMETLVRSWAHRKDRPTAVFSAQRITSIRLMQAVHHAGLNVPKDLAIVGFDDFELAEVLGTPLTVVAQSPSDLARAGAELLFKHIEQRQQERASVPEPPVRMVYPTRLLIRASCGCT